MSPFHSFYKFQWCENWNIEIFKAFYIARNNNVAVNRLCADGGEAVFKVGSSMRKGFFYVPARHISDTNNRKELFDCMIASFIIM